MTIEKINSVTSKTFTDFFKPDHKGIVGTIKGIVKQFNKRPSKKYNGKVELVAVGLFEIEIDGTKKRTTLSFLPRHINEKMAQGERFEFNLARIETRDSTKQEPQYMLVIDNTPTDDEWALLD